VNEEILERLKQINLNRGEKLVEKRVAKHVEEESADEINEFPVSMEQSEDESLNNMPNDLIDLRNTLNNEINEEIPKTISRIQRCHYHKIKIGLKLVMDDIKNIFRRINENDITDKTVQEKEMIELAFKYMTSRLRRHISEKIGKDKNKKEKPMEMRPVKKNGGGYDEQINAKELKEIEVKYDNQLTTNHKAIGKLKEIHNLRNEMKLNNDFFDYDENEPPPPSRKTLERLELLTLAEISKVEEKPLERRNRKILMTWICYVNRTIGKKKTEQWKEGVELLRDKTISDRAKRIAYIRQMQYADDPKRVFKSLIRDKTPMCEIETDIIHAFFEDRWEKMG
jgi:hypothetical protein